MKRPPAAVSARFVNDFLQGIRIDGGTRERLLRQAGIPPVRLEEPGTRVPEEQFAALYRLLVVQLDDEMPGMFSRPLRSGATKLLCLSLLDAPSLHVALVRYIRFHRIVLDDFTLALERGPAEARFAIVPGAGAAPPPAIAQKLLLKFLHSLASWLTAQNLPVLRVHFAFAPPPDAQEDAYLYPGAACFHAPASALCFPAAVMDMPLAHRTREDVRRFLARAPEGWIFAGASAPTVSQRVREYLENHAGGRSDVESAAAALHYSVRTLCRRLEAEGTSFRLLKDELRRDLAVQRLAETSRSVGAIALELGFEDATAFYRAFKNWTGSTPGVYRRGRGEGVLAAREETRKGAQPARNALPPRPGTRPARGARALVSG